ncbi:SDR family NAD(P)-dependent oxidoreductase [Iocasia frigidifontis]|uniref:SDR family NAD(P)-dependent oxidoreductase n=1 Tax=Iocasia fonsfrigidae TaxID=2682810 RepID=A0A8A7KC35_9FIRM|nr:SDR family oxidoreductase [Iocasia fonsfrigidae]QTL99011.1 SDR family NAD(P)-dependent oxidoreductase [Iocasia fonsfrigidae]
MKEMVLVTGASSGIGMDFARIFAEKGYNLVLVARREEKLKSLAKELGKKYKAEVKVIPKDLSMLTSSEEIFEELRKENINIDILVNSAGTQVYGNFLETDLDKEMKMMQVNVNSLVCLTKLAVNQMKEKGKGRILNLASTGAFMPVPLNSIYCASKAFVLHFSEGIKKDLEGSGITVTTLCPGPTKSEFAKKAQMTNTRLFSRMMDSRKVAMIGYKALMKGKRVVVPGFSNKLMAISYRFTPRSLLLSIGKYIMNKK